MGSLQYIREDSCVQFEEGAVKQGSKVPRQLLTLLQARLHAL